MLWRAKLARLRRAAGTLLMHVQSLLISLAGDHDSSNCIAPDRGAFRLPQLSDHAATTTPREKLRSL